MPTNYTFLGEGNSDLSGWSVSDAGDIDGDGLGDFIVGAFSAADNDPDTSISPGSVYIIKGADLSALDAADGTVDGQIQLSSVASVGTSFELVGKEDNDQLGFSVSAAGDVDNDGNDDLIIGAPGAGAGGGQIFVIQADALDALDAADDAIDGVVDITNAGQVPGSYAIGVSVATGEYGFAVAGAGQVNDDPFSDILVGAPEDNTVQFFSGELLSKPFIDGGLLSSFDLASEFAPTGGYVFIGESEGDRTGASLTAVGDVDGDGTDDFLIGAPGGFAADGKVFLISGVDLEALDAADGEALNNILLENVAGTGSSYKFVGSNGEQAGISVSAAGDVDEDGKADFLIGAHENSDGAFLAGKTYLIKGADLAELDAADGTVDGVVNLSDAFPAPPEDPSLRADGALLENAEEEAPASTHSSYAFQGEGAADAVGRSVGSAGDVDGDGKTDILIGAPFLDAPDITSPGGAYLINANDLATLDAADGSIDHTILLERVAGTGSSYLFYGPTFNDAAGQAVSSAGDVDDDGMDELLIAAPSAAAGPDLGLAGQTFLVDGESLADLDAEDGTVDGVIYLENVDCFHAGTEIATPNGVKRVEDLEIGDLVQTADGRAVPVRWIGRQTVTKRFHGERARPVRISAGAFGNGVPHRDLTVTSDHGMILYGQVINASALVNGTSITKVPLAELADRFTVFHVETPQHDIILANGAASETFVDYRGRQAFDNYAEFSERYGTSQDIAELPLPRIAAIRNLPRHIQARLNETAPQSHRMGRATGATA